MEPQTESGHARADGRRTLLLCSIPLLLACYKTVCFLTDYGIAWQHPEVGFWKPVLAAWGFPASLHDLWRMFDWQAIEERDPRVTRPLASLFELYDTPLRSALFQHIFLLPSFSMTWLFTLFLTPLLLFLLLRRLGVEAWLAVLALALYAANPGILSLTVNLYRPGKPLALPAILLSLWLGARQDQARREVASGIGLTLRFAGLCFVTFLGLFTDENAVIALPALVVLFPQLVFRNKETTMLFALIPFTYFFLVRHTLPELSAVAGYPLPGRYTAEVSMEKFITFQFPFGSYVDELFNILINIGYILPDCFGIISPELPHSIYYIVLFCLLIVFFYRCYRALRAAWRERLGLPQGIFRDDPRALAWRSLLALFIAFIYEGMLMSVSLTDHILIRPWGLYWYGVLCVPFLIIALALVCHQMRATPVTATFFTTVIVAAMLFIFPATNEVYKDTHYYALSTEALNNYFANRLDRFDVPPSDGPALKAKTEELWRARLTHAPVYNAPMELSYVLYELRFIPGPNPCTRHYFDIQWRDNQAYLFCHHAVTTNDKPN